MERPLDLPVPQARVPSVRRALGPVAATLAGHPSRSMRCLGVTGTNGKTTTTYLLEAIARDAGDTVGVIGTVGARIAGDAIALERTTPEADELQAAAGAHARRRGVATVAMEVSSHALAQHRVDGTWFAAVCFTNLSHDHLDYHGTLDAYFEAKAALFDPRERVGVGGQPRRRRTGVRLSRASPCCAACRSRRSGTPPTADVTARSIRLRRDRDALRHCTTSVRGSRRDVELALVGAFNVSNALAAAATALAAGFDLRRRSSPG